ncbi:aldehyde dehydrogenase family protein [Streptacidiphilus sp. P02-A3a]|uniref:aldehyde dehydrogenase family protein n=1 Tax=Streptacidiphilus sp. P02-A3a TaxID=2704468 RepID=UPI0015FA43AF|nr:aldehyde dehydrogenase family protein [Streptacidiphilus sp. P02-A3a]QMU71349.1 aldehyde dehydrogenase family protein [Streptacidiphilus sp. P02-A3a]
MDKHQHPWADCVFVDGRFQPPLDGGRSDIRDKSTDEVFATAGDASAADVDAAAASAVTAQRDWAARGHGERAAVLRRVAAALESATGLVELIMRETGCVAGKAEYEISAAVDELTEAAALASRPVGEVLRTSHPGRSSVCERVPVGLVAVITPWNFPLVLGMRVIAPALALGNAVLLKPSPETPGSGGLAIAELFARAGAPAGILQVLPGGERVGRRLVEHPDVAMVHFTGSTTVGREIARTAGSLLKRTSLELGGNNALLVLDDADVDQAAMIGAWSSFHYQGQTCISAGRHIVDRRVAEAYLRNLTDRAAAITVGDPLRQRTGLGPIINDAQLARARRLLDEAVAGGARVLTGGTNDGRFFRPTVVVDVDPASALWTEEIFAPIAPVAVVDGAEQAVALANDTRYGLVCSVLGADVHRAAAVAERLTCAMVHVNDATPQDEALAPFGGIGDSGLGGRAGGDANLDEFTERRWRTVTGTPVHYPY